MVIVHVFIHVRPDSIEKFREASMANASSSIREPGVARFDVLQQDGEPERFVLFEVYRSEAAVSDHKLTEHYRRWKESVEGMMAEPRHSIRYTNIFPGDESW